MWGGGVSPYAARLPPTHTHLIKEGAPEEADAGGATAGLAPRSLQRREARMGGLQRGGAPWVAQRARAGKTGRTQYAAGSTHE